MPLVTVRRQQKRESLARRSDEPTEQALQGQLSRAELGLTLPGEGRAGPPPSKRAARAGTETGSTATSGAWTIVQSATRTHHAHPSKLASRPRPDSRGANGTENSGVQRSKPSSALHTPETGGHSLPRISRPEQHRESAHSCTALRWAAHDDAPTHIPRPGNGVVLADGVQRRTHYPARGPYDRRARWVRRGVNTTEKRQTQQSTSCDTGGPQRSKEPRCSTLRALKPISALPTPETG